MSLPREAMGKSAVCDCGISWPCSTDIFSCDVEQLKYTQKKKFSQYLCFLIKSTILHISLSNFIHELYYRNFICSCYCVTNYASVRLYQPNFKMHDVHVLR